MVELEPPRLIDGRSLLIAGISQRHHHETPSTGGIPAQWQRFLPHLGKVPGQVGRKAYGVSYNGDGRGNFDYLCGVEVADFNQLGPEWHRLSLDARRYAVFTHRGPLPRIQGTWQAIYQWLPGSGYKRARAPDFELYGETFDARSNSGVVEIWIPIEA